MSSPRISKRHDHSAGRLSMKGPTHSTPIKSYMYRESRDRDALNMSSPTLRDTSTSSSAIAAAVRKNLAGAVGLNDSKIRSRSKTSSEYDSMLLSEQASTHQAKLADFENQTIQKQRQELAMMIAELRDRDRELNDMVAAHQKQQASWEQDRKKLLAMEEKCARLERDILNKNDDIRSLTAKLRVVQCEDLDKSTALNNTQEQLLVMSEQSSQASLQMQDMEQRNHSLASSMREVSFTVGQLQAREQELLTVLQLKDRDLSEASCNMAELSARLGKMEKQYSEVKAEEAINRRKTSDWKNKCSDQQREVEYTKKLLLRSEQRTDEQHVEIQRIRQEVGTLKKELTLAGEREKRKDQLLDLAKSRQDRSDAELHSLRQLYERQQRDLSLLHLNLESTKDLLHRHHIDFPGMGSIGLPRKSPMHSSYRMGSYHDSSYRPLSNSHIETTNYQYEADIKIVREPSPILNEPANKSAELDDNDLDSDRPESPTDEQLANLRLAAARQTSVKETDSAATKLHKLLTESRDMVEELEKSVGEKEQSKKQSTSKHSKPQRTTPHKGSPQRTSPQPTTSPQPDDLESDTNDYKNEFEREVVREESPLEESASED